MVQFLSVFLFLLIFLIFYSYIGYGILLFIITRFKKKPSFTASSLPDVTIIIPAYNEADILQEKIHNTLSLNYPDGLLKIIVITDGSTDSPEKILAAYPGVLHLHEAKRKGKSAAINRAMKEVTTSVTIFTDANSILNAEAILKLAEHFANPLTGGVSGEKRIISNKSSDVADEGEGMYWKYESALKKMDARLFSIVGAAGELFAIRSKLYKPLEEDTILDDFVLSLRICESGFRIAYEPSAIAYERASASVEEEYKRKTRIAAGAFQAMGRLHSIWNPFRHPVLHFQFISHRILRWVACPPALVLLLILNILLVLFNGGTLFEILLFLQLLFYAFAFTGFMLSKSNISIRIFNIPFYFVFMNYCLIAGFFRYLWGNQAAEWEKVIRKPL